MNTNKKNNFKKDTGKWTVEAWGFILCKETGFFFALADQIDTYISKKYWSADASFLAFSFLILQLQGLRPHFTVSFTKKKWFFPFYPMNKTSAPVSKYIIFYVFFSYITNPRPQASFYRIFYKKKWFFNIILNF